jgi:anti-sigma B factor antagonist
VQTSTRQAGNATVIDVVGDIDLYNSPEMRKALLEVLRNQRAPIVMVNLTKVKYIDSSGVASLVEGLKISRELQSRFILYGLSPAAREVLELSRLIKVFEVHANEEEALKAIG